MKHLMDDEKKLTKQLSDMSSKRTKEFKEETKSKVAGSVCVVVVLFVFFCLITQWPLLFLSSHENASTSLSLLSNALFSFFYVCFFFSKDTCIPIRTSRQLQ